MEQMEILLWLSIVEMARKGDPESQETLTAQNNIRKKKNLPTVEQELQEIAQQQEDEAMYDQLMNGKVIYSRPRPKK